MGYVNHQIFRKKDKRGSPVRIFTNIPAREVTLSEEEGYRCVGGEGGGLNMVFTFVMWNLH